MTSLPVRLTHNVVVEKNQKQITWRRLLRDHAAAFASWLAASGREREVLERISGALAGFLIEEIDQTRQEWPAAPAEFWSRIPDVRRCCNETAAFDKPLAVHAYAYVHFLERYRRTWASLKYLADVALLPLGSRGVRTLDVGCGPAPVLYATRDFYRALYDFAEFANVCALRLPLPELACVEQSRPMMSFVHHFSEYCKEPGPFGAHFDDFSVLDLKQARADYRRRNEYDRYWDGDDVVNPWAAEEANVLFRYRLVVFSNFLTLGEQVQMYETQLRDLFRDLRPGSIVLVLGGTGDSYQRIYEHVKVLALDEGLREAAARTTFLERDDEVARIIKAAQHRVYQHIESVSDRVLDHAPSWPDYWTREPSPKSRPKFELRAFRRGKWPKAVITAA